MRSSSISPFAKPPRWTRSSGCLLEVAWEALEHAGIPASSLRRFADRRLRWGVCVSEYGYLASTDLPGVDAWSNNRWCAEHHREIGSRIFWICAGPSVTVDNRVLVVVGRPASGVSEPTDAGL